MNHSDFDKQFDRQFYTINRAAFVGAGASLLIGGGTLALVGWAVWKLVTHFTQGG